MTLSLLIQKLVPWKGLEPPHISAAGPKPAASTNFATRALTLLTAAKSLFKQGSYT